MEIIIFSFSVLLPRVISDLFVLFNPNDFVVMQ